MSDWQRHLEVEEDRHLSELFEFLRIPTVSALAEYAPDVRAGADWLSARMRAAGVPTVEVLETGGSPLVFGYWSAAHQQRTALIYGHYDVQPPDPLELWTTPPFEPTLRDGRLYARGAADDKSGVMIALTAVEALTHGGNAPPVNLIFFFEGEEEIGSPNLAPFVHAERERLACNMVLSADGGMYGPDQPSLTVSTKGLAGCALTLRTARTDMHSGKYGAIVPNAIQSIVQLAASLHAGDGRVAVDGFYDDVRPLSLEDRDQIAAVPFDEAELRADTGIEALWGEPHYTPQERGGSRPTLDFNGIWGGFQGEGAKTVTPSEAHLKITCRLVPDQTPDKVLTAIERHIERNAPIGARVSVERLPGSALPFAIPLDHVGLQTARGVLRDEYGVEPLVVREGGTLPVAETFQRELGADMVFFAFSAPGSQAHAPNEWFRLEDFRRGRRAWARLLTALAH
ncbi:MAG: dipeptidase [Chloroflexota bacterium]|nr:dipeptidase [Chloroflexota bacterium]